MKILITTGVYPPEIGGPATYTKRLEEGLPKFGFDVTVLPFSRVRRYPKLIRHLVYFFLVIKLSHGKDIIYAQDPVSVGFPSSIAAFILRKKFALKVVGDYAWEQGVGRFGVEDILDNFLMKKQHGMVQFLQHIERFVANRADQIIVPSKYLKGVISAWGVKSPIAVVYNGISVPKSPQNSPRMTATGRFLTVGRLVPWKGIEALIEAFSELPELSLDIVGSGPEEENLKEKVKDLGLAERVHFLGSVEHEKLEESYIHYDALLLNTSYEGFSHQIIESMNVGLVVITTNAGGNKEIAVNHKNSLVVELNNVAAWRKVILKIQDINLQEQLRSEAYRSVSKFTIEKTIEETAQILKQML